MRLEGTLDAFSLPDIFQLLSFTKKTGALHLRKPQAHGVVHFSAGSVTGASSDVARHQLARRLVGAVVASEESLAAAVERAATDALIGVGRALSEAGAVDQAILHGFVAEQAVDSVFDLLRWPNGDFAFVVDEGNPDELGVLLPVDEVVAEARRRLEFWQTVSRTIPSPECVPGLVPAPASDPVVSRDEWVLLGLLDGRRTVADLVALTGRGEYAVVSALAALVDRGLVAVSTREDSDAGSVLARRQALLGRLGAPADDEPASGVDAGVATGVPASEDAVPADSATGYGAASGGPAVPPVSAPPATAAVPSSVPSAVPNAVPSAVPNAVPAAVPAGAGSGTGAGNAGPAMRTSTAAGTRVVTPPRSEPFLPRRLPDHLEDQALNAPVVSTSVGPVVGSAAVATNPAPASSPSIERDPSVNKSLLLRLIAGVRGL